MGFAICCTWGNCSLSQSYLAFLAWWPTLKNLLDDDAKGKRCFNFPFEFFFKSVMYPLPFSSLLTLIHLVILDSSCMLMANALSSWGVFIVGLLVFSFFFVVCLFDLARNGWMRGFFCSVWWSWIEGRYEIHSGSDNWPYEISANGYEWGFLNFVFFFSLVRFLETGNVVEWLMS